MNAILINMDLSRPYSAVAATVDGDVLIALAGTTRPSTGRQVARLVRRGSQPAVNAALDRLVRHGLVHRTAAPPALLYTLNREHVGYAAVEALAAMRTDLLHRLRELFAGWAVSAVHVSMFGSAARADGGIDSDIDLVVVRPSGVPEEDDRWRAQLSELTAAVCLWTGNPASIAELAEETLPRFLTTKPPVLADWRRDAVHLAGRSIEETIGAAK
jgi:predicted nucleotidyltransferase